MPLLPAALPRPVRPAPSLGPQGLIEAESNFVADEVQVKERPVRAARALSGAPFRQDGRGGLSGRLQLQQWRPAIQRHRSRAEHDWNRAQYERSPGGSSQS